MTLATSTPTKTKTLLQVLSILKNGRFDFVYPKLAFCWNFRSQKSHNYFKMTTSSLLFVFVVVCCLFLASSRRKFVPSNFFQVKTPSNGMIPVTSGQQLKQNVEQVVLTTAIFSSLSFGIVAPCLAVEVKKKAKKPKVLEVSPFKHTKWTLLLLLNAFLPTELGIKYIILKPGSGPYPNPGDFVTPHF